MRKVMREKDGTRTQASVCYLLGKHFYCSLEDEDIEGKAVNETETISLLYSYTHAHTHTHTSSHTHTHTHAHTHALTKTLAQITSTSLKVFAVKRKSHSLRMFKELFPANVQ